MNETKLAKITKHRDSALTRMAKSIGLARQHYLLGDLKESNVWDKSAGEWAMLAVIWSKRIQEELDES